LIYTWDFLNIESVPIFKCILRTIMDVYKCRFFFKELMDVLNTDMSIKYMLLHGSPDVFKSFHHILIIYIYYPFRSSQVYLNGIFNKMWRVSTNTLHFNVSAYRPVRTKALSVRDPICESNFHCGDWYLQLDFGLIQFTFTIIVCEEAGCCLWGQKNGNKWILDSCLYNIMSYKTN